MEGLKPGWRRWRFEQMATNLNVRVDDPSEAGVDYYVGLEHLDSDSLKIRRWGSPEDVSATKLLFEPGDIIFGRRRAYQRKLGVAEWRGIASAHSLVLRAKPDVVLPELLPFFMQSDLFMDRAQRISVGSLSPTINWKTLAKQEFALPPLEERRRIARAIQKSADLWVLLQDSIFEAQRMRATAIDHLLSTPKGADETKLADVAAMQNGRPFPGSDYLAEGIRLLRPGNLGVSGYLVWPQSKTVCLPESWKDQASDFLISSGDLLINLTAHSLEDGFMGRVCLAREGDESLLNQRIGRIQTDQSRLSLEYLFRALQTSRFRQHADSHCEGTKVKHLFWSHLSRYSIFIPQISAQREIASHCAEVDAAVSSLFRRRKRAREQHFGLINDSVQGMTA